MSITKSGPRVGKSPVKNRNKCWECGDTAPVFAINPNGNPVCQKCAPRLFEGVIAVAKKTNRP